MSNRVDLIINNKVFLLNYNKIVEFEKDRIFCKHDMDHLLNVARIMVIKNFESYEFPYQKDIIYAIALLHDIGRAMQYECGIPHDIAGGDLCSQILKDCDYSDEEIDLIKDSIIKHREEERDNDLASLLYFADKKSRSCFVCPSRDLCNWSDDKKNTGIEI